MLALNRTDRNVGLRLREDPGEVVQRLGRLDIGGADLTQELTHLGQDRLQQLASLTQQALKRLGVNDGGNGRARRPAAHPVISRDTDFGD